jgi:squalene-hopene/tetraprenyl-beta-curcumene cyclase
MHYLSLHQNHDGGFGDTDRSYSNIATSYLVLAASSLAEKTVGAVLTDQQQANLDAYIEQANALEGLRRRYGTDQTFVVPILTNLAIAGCISWAQVPALPFEMAAVPQQLYRWMRMPVVSYAVPALVAIGQARHVHGRRTFLPLWWLRQQCIHRTLRVLEWMQPDSGGYLEAVPLTSFVIMSLAVTGRVEHTVVTKGIEFLKQSVAEDGSLPIDTNLATWVTSLAIHALRCDSSDTGDWCDDSLVEWHLNCQHRTRHPFTGADPGGWGWTDLSGAVPDGDDTPGAILALLSIRSTRPINQQSKIDAAVKAGADWLLRLQNRDGGWPTFCRGWGKLPFDRSSNDLTAHAIRALRAVIQELKPDASWRSVCVRAIERGESYLCRAQQANGDWLPLWFGNQDELDEINPVYGTARVLLAADPEAIRRNPPMGQGFAAGVHALLARQNRDGGWGGGSSLTNWLKSGSKATEKDVVHSSMEETATAIEGLSHIARTWDSANLWESFAWDVGKDAFRSAIIRGVEFLVQGVLEDRHRIPWPIGFYFAKLWYHERLYPLVYTLAALGTFVRLTQPGIESKPNPTR